MDEEDENGLPIPTEATRKRIAQQAFSPTAVNAIPTTIQRVADSHTSFTISPPRRPSKQLSSQPVLSSAGLSSAGLSSAGLSSAGLSRAGLSTAGTTGLQNLGNTCFMNSALQCLSNTAALTHYFLLDKWKEELNIDNPLGMKGKIPAAYSTLIDNLWIPSSSSYAPSEFKLTMGERNTLFYGYGQQDSHELLQSLLDGLHEDLNRVRKKQYVEDPEMEDRSEKQFAQLSWKAYLERNDSVIVDLFQAQLKNRTVCQTCHKVSIRFDPYMYLQVPIPEPTQQSIRVTLVPSADNGVPLQALRPVTLALRVPRHCSVLEFKRRVASRVGLSFYPENPQFMAAFEVFHSKIHLLFQDTDSIDDMAAADDIRVTPICKPAYLFEKCFPASSMVSTDNWCITKVCFKIDPPNFGLRDFFGTPLILTVPQTIVLSHPTAVHAAEKQIGEVFYRVIVNELRRYSRVALFARRPSSNDVQSINPVQNGVDRLDNSKQEVRQSWFEDLGDDWEPIPNLFKITLNRPDRFVSSSISSFSNRFGFKKKLLYPAPLVDEEHHPTNDSSWKSYDGLDRPKKQLNHSSAFDNGPNSPISEASDLAERINQTTRITNNQDASDPSVNNSKTVEMIESFHIGLDSEFILEFEPGTAKALFGEDAVSNSMLHKDNPEDMFAPVIDEKSISEAMEEERIDREKTITLKDCLNEFSKEEILDGDDTLYCSNCKDHRPISKKLDAYSAPPILVVHLKRFSNGRSSYSRTKIDSFIDAPMTGLDLSDILGCAADVENRNDLIYDLHAVSNHFGGLGGGHYTAYVKNPIDDEWYNCDDSRVSPVGRERVIQKAAYLLFYTRRSFKTPDLASIIDEAKERIAKERAARALESQQALPSYMPYGPPPLPSLDSHIAADKLDDDRNSSTSTVANKSPTLSDNGSGNRSRMSVHEEPTEDNVPFESPLGAFSRPLQSRLSRLSPTTFTRAVNQDGRNSNTTDHDDESVNTHSLELKSMRDNFHKHVRNESNDTRHGSPSPEMLYDNVESSFDFIGSNQTSPGEW